MPVPFHPGDLIQFRTEPHKGEVAVVSNPGDEHSTGHVITLCGGHLRGVDVTENDVAPVGPGSNGFAQLANTLIKLGSHVIEERPIVSRK